MKKNVLFITLLFIIPLFLSTCAPAPRYGGVKKSHSTKSKGKATTKKSSSKKISKKSSGKVYQTGIASWYGPGFQGNKTANGERFDMHAMTAAHKKLPFHTKVEVTAVETGKKVVVRINDRGPFVKGRVIDLSKKAAKQLGIIKAGHAKVKIRIIE